MNIIIGSDHAGFELKQHLIDFLMPQHNIIDVGPNSIESVDYPDYAHLVSKEVNSNNSYIGILICGSGNGMVMTSNKYPNIRASLCWNNEISKLSRQHNNANIICLPARFIDIETSENIISTFLNTEFEGGRHETRINKINSNYTT